MKALDHAPPRLSDLRGDDLRAALRDRHDANREAWLREHEEAGRTLGDRIARWFRAIVRRYA